MDAAWESPLRRRMRERQPVVGCTLTTSSLDVAARAAAAGFHFLWVELEHSPLTLETVRNIVLATRGLPAVPIARVAAAEPWMARQALDAGVHGVVVPFVGTPALARQAADACRYPPVGRRGAGEALAAASWPEAGRYYDSADANVLVVVVIEEASALDHLDEIAATPGVDVIFLGTGDLSFSLGLRGRQDDRRIEDAAAAVLAAATRHGKVAGRPASTPERARASVDQGFLFIQGPTDLGLFDAAARQFLEK